MRILDGGIVDNSGMDAVLDLFRGLQHVAQSSATAAQKADAIMKNVAQRGLVVLEIDSGAQPTPARTNGVFSWFYEPIRALDNGLYANAESTKQLRLEELRELLGRTNRDLLEQEFATAAGSMSNARALSDAPWDVVVAHRFRCNHLQRREAEVMTAWALGPRDKAKIVSQFCAVVEEWKRSREELRRAWLAAAVAIEAQRKQEQLVAGAEFLEQCAEANERTQIKLAAKMEANGKAQDPGASKPDPAFVAEWKTRMLAAGTDLARSAGTKVGRLESLQREELRQLGALTSGASAKKSAITAPKTGAEATTQRVLMEEARRLRRESGVAQDRHENAKHELRTLQEQRRDHTLMRSEAFRRLLED